MSMFQKFKEDFRLDGKCAVVTGGCSGIGEAAARMLARKGAQVVVLDRSPSAAALSGENLTGIQVELTDSIAIQKVVEKICTSHSGIDILCNIAGIGSGVPAQEITREEFLQVMEINCLAAFFLTQAVGRTMIASARGGRIINVASDAGVMAVQNHVAYSASKAALLSVTRTLALEWGQYGITCNAISPTVVMTPMSREYWKGERGAKQLEKIPVGRFGEMDEIAAAVAFLASDATQMINGHNLMVDGGITIC